MEDWSMETAQELGLAKTSSEDEPSGMGWRELLFWLAAGLAAALIVGTVALGEIIPPIVAFAILFLVGAALARRVGKAGPILIGVPSVVLVGLNAPFIAETATVPASTADFLLATVPTVLAVAALVASVGALRRHGAAREAPRRVGLVSATLIVLLVGVAVAARLAYDEPTVAAGDVTLATQDIEFSPATVTAKAGEITVFVENRDNTLHTFTIEELGVDLRIPGRADAKVTFDAASGSYQFVCTPHESMGMTGTLEVE